MNPKHPDITVELDAMTATPFPFSAAVAKPRAAILPEAVIDAFTAEATAGDYDHLLRTAMRWFDIR